jgi:rhodanese-related sulfurtransferase
MFIFAFFMIFTLTAASCAVGNRSAVMNEATAVRPAVDDDSAMLKENEKRAWEKAATAFPVERQLNVQQFKELYDKVMAGQDKDAKIVLWCRTHKRGAYVGERLRQFGYTNVWWYKDGIVGWINAGHPLCNQFMGLFEVTDYHKYFMEIDQKTKKPMYRIREFHPY